MNGERNGDREESPPADQGFPRAFLPFLCIAKQVAGYGVNSNNLNVILMPSA